jgi:O-antigen ligase
MQIIYIILVIISIGLTIYRPIYGINFLLFNFLLQPHKLLGFAQITTQLSNLFIGLTLVLLLPFRKVKLPENGISALAILFFISGLISSFLNLGPRFLAMEEQYRIFWMGINRAGFVFLLMRYLCTRGDFLFTFNSIVALGGITAIYTVTDYFFHFTYDPNVKGGRAIGLFGDPNAVAANLVALIPITYYVFLHGKLNWLRRIYIINICAQVMGVFCTASRAGLLALFLISAFLTGKNLKRFSTFLFIGLLILIFMFYGKNLYLQREAKQKTITTTLSGKIRIESSAFSRIQHIKFGVLLWLKNPFFGVGVSNAPQAIQEQLGIRQIRPHIHNTYFSVLAEYGLSGFLLYMGLFFLSFRSLNRLSNHDDPYFNEIATYLRFSLLSHMFTSFFIGNWVELMQWIAIALPVALDQISKFEQLNKSK